MRLNNTATDTTQPPIIIIMESRRFNKCNVNQTEIRPIAKEGNIVLLHLSSYKFRRDGQQEIYDKQHKNEFLNIISGIYPKTPQKLAILHVIAIKTHQIINNKNLQTIKLCLETLNRICSAYIPLTTNQCSTGLPAH